MSYNNQSYGMPYGYQNNYPYGNVQIPQQPFQPQMNMNANIQNNQPTGNFYAIVNGIEGAKQYPVLSNQTVLLMDSSNPIIYSKKANGLGQVSIECFKLVPINEGDINIPSDSKTGVDQEFALKNDVLELSSKLDTLSARFDKLISRFKDVNKGSE